LALANWREVNDSKCTNHRSYRQGVRSGAPASFITGLAVSGPPRYQPGWSPLMAWMSRKTSVASVTVHFLLGSGELDPRQVMRRELSDDTGAAVLGAAHGAAPSGGGPARPSVEAMKSVFWFDALPDRSGVYDPEDISYVIVIPEQHCDTGPARRRSWSL
jgi:hypothetical protein